MFVELRLTVPIIAHNSAPLLALCGQNGGCETMEKDRAKASLASSMFDTVDSRFLESSSEKRIKKKIDIWRIGDKTACAYYPCSGAKAKYALGFRFRAF